MSRYALFLSSYTPLFAILAMRIQSQDVFVACVVLACLGLACTFWVLQAERSKGAASFRVEAVEDGGAEVSGYLATYLLPFVAVPEPTGRDVLAYAAFLTVACVIYVRSEMLQINPTFYLIGRRVVRMSVGEGTTMHLICRARPLVGATLLATTLSTGVLVESNQRSPSDGAGSGSTNPPRSG